MPALLKPPATSESGAQLNLRLDRNLPRLRLPTCRSGRPSSILISGGWVNVPFLPTSRLILAVKGNM